MAGKKQAVELDLFDRTLLKTIFIEKRDNIGGLDNLRLSINVLNKIEITDEEIETCGIEQTDTSVRWDPTKNDPKAFELTGKEYDLCKKFIETKTDWSLDIRNLQFAERFGVKLGEDEEDAKE